MSDCYCSKAHRAQEHHCLFSIEGTFVEPVWICANTIISSVVQMPLMQQMVPAFMFADVSLKYHFLPVAFYSVYRKYLVK